MYQDPHDRPVVDTDWEKEGVSPGSRDDADTENVPRIVSDMLMVVLLEAST